MKICPCCQKEFSKEDILERDWIVYTRWNTVDNYNEVKLVGFDCDCQSSIAVKPEFVGVE